MYFSIKTTPNLIFGANRYLELPTLLVPFGRRILVVIGSQSLVNGPHWPALTKALGEMNFLVFEEQVTAEPAPEEIDILCARYPEGKIEAVVAIGGGSVLDAGKAIAAMLVERKPLATLLEGVGSERPSGATLPFIAVPTTSGTGSEATSNAVFRQVGKDGFKKSLRHDNYIPDIALVDPQLSSSCPPRLTAACGMDTFTQLVEAYLSTKGSPLIDTLALDGIRAVVRSLTRAFQNGEDLGARADLAYGSYLSGIALTNSGLGAVHGLAGPLGGLFPIPHGLACALLMAPVNRQTLENLRAGGTSGEALAKYSTLDTITGATASSPDKAGDHFLHYLEKLSATLIRERLVDYGITAADIPRIVARADNKNNPASLDDDQWTSILRGLIP